MLSNYTSFNNHALSYKELYEAELYESNWRDWRFNKLMLRHME